MGDSSKVTRDLGAAVGCCGLALGLVLGCATVDSGNDVYSDAGTDPSPDAGFDVPVDTDVETALDSTTDPDLDAGTDTAIDTGVDTALDIAPDTGLDTTADTAIDTGVDTALDTVAEPDADGVATECLIFSEYIDGNYENRGFELYNCGTSAISLSAYTVCLVSNVATACGATLTLSGTLAAGDVVTICGPYISSSNYDIALCDFLDHPVTSYNGDDRLRLTRSGVIVDAFGELAVMPSGAPWEDVTMRRCDPTPYLGVGTFDDTLYYTTTAWTFSNFGIAPTSMPGCP